MARRGGHQQRRAQDARDDEPPAKSVLAEYLTEHFGVGIMPGVTAQKIAHLAVRNHSESPKELKPIAKLGTDGRHPNHVAHQFMKMLQPKLMLNVVVVFTIIALSLKRDRDGEQIRMPTEHGMVAPLLVASQLWEKKRALFF